ncbi:hypothetical protein AWJ20_4851 [Sugiyamaella lignohabitans]|uniref:Uncharacterized protein n=1 Tax=Sugiyamaella lignohabitans TaxID=796027 RepID=A0A167ECC4_9ASCO|nr:uncharacterized protein AWJ20_4851 [Sugiyamaella lignohabitans]ANB13900.1 hypothetical protein AWJ20_4851 [Sugiyamaella lignohabitans]
MEGLEFASNFSFNRCSPQLSASGEYVAYVYGSRLVIRFTDTLATKNVIQLPREFAQNIFLIRWDGCLKHSPEQRVAVATRNEIRTFSIKKHSTAGESMAPDNLAGHSVILSGKDEIANVQWLSADTPNNIGQIVRLAVFTRFHLDVKIWSSNGVEMEIRSPKFARLVSETPNLSMDGLSNRFSVVSRFTTYDVLYNCRINATVADNELVTPLSEALDIVDLKWSPSGLWLAAIDNPIAGYDVHLWAADGTFVRTFHDIPGFISPNVNTTPSSRRKEDMLRDTPSAAFPTCLEWVNVFSDPGVRDLELLLVGDSENRVSLFDIKTCQPTSILIHGSVYKNCCLWEEYLSPDSHQFEYRMVRLPFIFTNSGANTSNSKMNEHERNIISGVISMDISDNGQLLATRVHSYPNLVWIWSIANPQSPDLLAIISHSYTIKSITWKSESMTPLLLITPLDSKSIGLWSYDSQLEPKIIDLSSQFESSIMGVSIIEKPDSNEILRLLAWTKNSFSIGGSVQDENDTGDAEDEGQDANDMVTKQQNSKYTSYQRSSVPRLNHHQSSRMELLSPTLPQDDDTHVKLLADIVQQSEWIQDTNSVPVEDTFHNKIKH